MDVVRAEVNGMGGRIETASRDGQGTTFRLVLPLTTAVTQVVMLRCGDLTVAVPSTLIEVVRRVPTDEVRQAYEAGSIGFGDERVPFFWLASLLQGSGGGSLEGRTQSVVVIRSASQRVALHIDEVAGNQEVVVKHLGPQLSRMPGLAGVTLLPSGAVALIYNPVALAALYGDELRARQASGGAPAEPERPTPVEAAQPPLVMVVDDSLTVRRVTQRLLEREGYRVLLAKDGVDALERLADQSPVVILCDIEMPRMDGFEFVRHLRADALRADLPVIMITSRIAQKHRDHAALLGVAHYLGKPFSEDKLLELVSEYARIAPHL
jgi:chemosensory pili system protein ChpA (sensor histidine kinase/response regulator)